MEPQPKYLSAQQTTSIGRGHLYRWRLSTSGYYAIANKELTKIEQVLPPMTYGGHGGFDEKTATLSGSFKGRGIGDCWSGNTAVWDGKTFVRNEEHTTGSCKGFAGGAWLMPIFETRIER